MIVADPLMSRRCMEASPVVFTVSVDLSGGNKQAAAHHETLMGRPWPVAVLSAGAFSW